ncbi:tetraspanin-18-like isoform X2 [Stegostoma tigrinum]|uniref:tetraspanin-18-like isoform X2 n=1 Tax=Stegostoma tigrinum TaxID=3053191 RepID=UPI00287059FE|nr:tetraspanin-18-like isoform X2 [Stegostoma tigrinum]
MSAGSWHLGYNKCQWLQEHCDFKPVDLYWGLHHPVSRGNSLLPRVLRLLGSHPREQTTAYDFAAVLALVFRKQIRKDYFLKELQMKYKGDNSTDAFSKTWNTIMMDFSCCGVNGPQDFGQNSTFHELFPNMLLPEACCKKNKTALVFLDKNRCFQGGAGYINSKGCFSMIAKNFRNYVHLVGAFSILVLLIELVAMAFTTFVYQTYN